LRDDERDRRIDVSSDEQSDVQMEESE
jgi:hypothetical protein